MEEIEPILYCKHCGIEVKPITEKKRDIGRGKQPTHIHVKVAQTASWKACNRPNLYPDETTEVNPW